ncbi:MAG: 1-deoxy-D-xylulose-5-phosphate synthase [Nevskia sp.]
MNAIPGYALLGGIDDPAALRALPRAELPRLAHEIRRYLIETLSRVGGHFAASLGTVELSLALHRVYDTPQDRLVWDIGHQAYPHKILTGRRARLETIRLRDGLAPFLDRSESDYDAFGAGHAGTSLSAAAGMAAAARLQRAPRKIAVIGDGAMSAGMAYEAMNNAGALGKRLIVILNDNDMSISENVGALRDRAARSLARAGIAAPHAARGAGRAPAAAEVEALFRGFGFDYHGPVDGHDLDVLIERLTTLRQRPGPQFLHAVTVKGRGYAPAERDPIAFHGVTRFDPVTGALPAKSADARPTYSQVFGDWLCAAAAADPAVVAITPAMREGSGLVEFERRFPTRYFDVGIAEQHAVTFAAGLATEGYKPFCAIYSTFLQRGYDQIVHDVAIQNLPVRFAIDRAGLVGADGATHAGSFDLSFLRCIPDLVVMAPSDAQECRCLLATGLAHQGPSAVRYPRGSGPAVGLADARPVALGKARVLREARGQRRPRVALLAFGSLVQTALDAADILDAIVVDMRFVKPLDEALIGELAARCELLVTLEENVLAGGAGSAVNEFLAQLPQPPPLLNLGLPDAFIAHGSREPLLAECGLDAAGVLRAIQKRLRLAAESAKRSAS